ncbi:hypothetical protein GSI_02295 [Ganoderma sinense ZZ0214-1]|uniref:Uncharacterized protein n=2 Tax=Ganoderma TaxID=5314 RepID=A0A2G8SP62_9APHY|nr:hypothetical protein GSI_02295 [Ganoderma sinense ZZ0214-1]
MYSSRNTYGTTPPELSNNPFIDHPANAMTRYPDITGSDNPANSQFTSWMNGPSTSSTGTNFSGSYGNTSSMSPQGYGGTPGYQSQPQATGWSQGSGFSQPQQSYGQYPSAPMQQQQQSPSGMPFQPTSSFGQQLQAHVNSAYNTPQPQQQQQPLQYSGYAAAQSPSYGQAYQQGYPGQQQQQHFSEFDPYAQGGQPMQQQTPGANGAPPSSSGFRSQHPREYVQHHKAELETWDSYSWKQAQNSFDDLKRAWEARKSELEARLKALGGAGLFAGGAGGYGGMYGGNPAAQQYAQVENMVKEATLNIDSIAASSFQMQEVFAGYRQSSDVASKRRVREAINAALTSLPDWPQPLMF